MDKLKKMGLQQAVGSGSLQYFINYELYTSYNQEINNKAEIKLKQQ